MLNKLFTIAAVMLCSVASMAQKKDTVIVNLAKTSQIIFTVEDPNDLNVLRHYDFQKLFDDVLDKLEEKNLNTASSDSSRIESNDEDPEVADIPSDSTDNDNEDDEDDYDTSWHRRDGDYNDDDDDDDDDWEFDRKWNRTWQTFNFDLGTNNYLENGKFPTDDKAYSVRPWGSWYVGLASIQRSRISKHFFLEWGLGMSWYNFKFEDDNTLIVKTDNGVEFTHDERDVDFKKSKLTVSYVHASLVPVFDLGDHGRKPRFWDGYHGRSFRMGVGPYVGYRIGSHSKLVYEDGGKEKEKDRDSFYLNNFRYGVRLQIGYRDTDLFFNYDLNELFKDNRGPNVNAFSFGVIF